MASKHNIGKKLKLIRESKQLSQQELAEKVNLDIEQLIKIEKGQFLPSLASLIKIARMLGVRLGTFLDDSDQLGPVIVRADKHEQGVRFSSQQDGSREHLNFLSLACNKVGRSMEPFIIEIEPGKQSDYMLSSHEGEEFIYVLEGEVEINYGKELYYLKKGDSIYLDSIISHNVHAGNSCAARILAVVYAPY